MRMHTSTICHTHPQTYKTQCLTHTSPQPPNAVSVRSRTHREGGPVAVDVRFTNMKQKGRHAQPDEETMEKKYYNQPE